MSEVKIKVTSQDDTKGTQQVIRNGFGVTGKEAGKQFSEELEKETSKGSEKAGKESGKKTSQKAKESAKSEMAGGLGWQALLEIGAPAAGMAAGVSITSGLALGLEGAVFAVARMDTQVQTRLSMMGQDIAAKAKDWATGLAAPVDQGLARIQVGFDHLAPEIDQALHNASTNFDTLAASAVSFADQAMPGVVRASSQLAPLFQGIKVAAGDMGKGTGDALDTLSQHSGTAGVAIQGLGKDYQILLGTAAPLIGHLTDLWAQHSAEVTQLVSSTGGAITGLATGALPVLGTAFGGEIKLISQFLTVLQPAAPVLGAVGSAALSAYTNVRLLGTLEGPLNSVSKKLQDAGDPATRFGQTTTTIGNAMGKLGNALPLVGIALTAVGVAEELDAQHGEELSATISKLSQELIQGGKAGSDASTQLNQLRFQASDAKDKIDQLEKSQVQGTQTASSYGLMAGSNATAIAENSQTIQDNKKVVDDSLKAYNDYAASLGAAAMNIDQLTGKTQVYAGDAQSASSNTAQLTMDMDVLSSSASTSQQRIQSLQDALKLLSDHGLEKADDAQDQFNSQLDAFVQQLANAKGGVLNVNGELNTLTERGRDTRQVMEQSRDSMVTWAQSAADAHMPASQITDQLNAMADQLVNTMVKAGMSRDAAWNLLSTYKLLPANIMTNIDANTTPAMNAANNLVRTINGMRAVVTVDAQGNTASVKPINGGRPYNAHGGVIGSAATGKVLPGNLTVVGEQGAELIDVPAGSSVIPHSGVGDALRQAGAGQGNGIQKLELIVGPGADQAVAKMINQLMREGQIQIRSQYIAN